VIIVLPVWSLLQGALFGALNLFVTILTWYIFRDRLKLSVLLPVLLVSIIITIGFVTLERFNGFIEHKLYHDNIIYSKTTPYHQHIVITRKKDRIKLYINGALQFDSFDEYRYHEMLIHPVMILTKFHKRILIIGGGDGLALREV